VASMSTTRCSTSVICTPRDAIHVGGGVLWPRSPA